MNYQTVQSVVPNILMKMEIFMFARNAEMKGEGWIGRQ